MSHNRAARATPTAHATWLIVLSAGLVLGACAGPSTRHVEHAPATPQQTPVYFYPTHGQSPAQQDRDRYECYLWAKKQTGFDPSDPRLAPHQRFSMVSSTPPGQGAAVGAVTGAVLGSVVARPGHSAEGAVVGAVAGAVLGTAAETAHQQETVRAYQSQQTASLEHQASNYRRALTACLEGRHYTVR